MTSHDFAILAVGLIGGAWIGVTSFIQFCAWLDAR